MEIAIEYTKVFERTLEALEDDANRFVINQGGSRSSKTWSAIQIVIYLALTRPGMEITCVAKTMPQLKKTAIKDFLSVMENSGLYDEERYWTNQHYTFPNGSVVEFFSVDSGAKVRGTSRDFLYITEANSLWDDDFLQLQLRTRWKILLDFNPDHFPDWLENLILHPKTKLMYSTFRDNPYLEQSQIDDIEYLRHTDPGMYQIFNLGQRAQTKEHVLTHWSTGKKPVHLNQCIYGMDFGWNHPTTVIRVWHNGNGKEFFLEQVVWTTQTDIEVIADEMNLARVGKADVIADHARPDLISKLRRLGFNMREADKAVEKGIYVLQTSVITLDEDSKDLIANFKNYRFKKTKGKLSDEVVKEDDDGPDAVRYAAVFLRGRSQPGGARVR